MLQIVALSYAKASGISNRKQEWSSVKEKLLALIDEAIQKTADGALIFVIHDPRPGSDESQE
jgi:hypothetical protein